MHLSRSSLVYHPCAVILVVMLSLNWLLVLKCFYFGYSELVLGAIACLGKLGREFSLLKIVLIAGVVVSPQGSHLWTPHYIFVWRILTDYVILGSVLNSYRMGLVDCDFYETGRFIQGFQNSLLHVCPSCPP